MRALRTAAVTGMLAAGGVALALLPASGASAGGQSELGEVRQATAQFHDLQVALDADYVQGSPCVPGMGFHYVNHALLADPAIDPLQPEVLLYAPSGNGKLKLVAVEWVVFDENAEATYSLMGQTFHGPMTHGLPQHYELHAYIWQGNPDGVFNQTNRNITCDGA